PGLHVPAQRAYAAMADDGGWLCRCAVAGRGAAVARIVYFFADGKSIDRSGPDVCSFSDHLGARPGAERRKRIGGDFFISVGYPPLRRFQERRGGYFQSDLLREL